MRKRARSLACACVVVCDKSSPSRVAAHASNKGVDGRREEREGQEGGRAQWRKGPERERGGREERRQSAWVGKPTDRSVRRREEEDNNYSQTVATEREGRGGHGL